jgi:2-polyprenyl-3-methyl-5-hydroxy-6-metoxy-1,4-benzoquinol methylase
MTHAVTGVRDYFNYAYQKRTPSQHEWTAGTANPELVNLVYEGTIPAGAKVLEIGCGLGTESVFMAVRGMEVTALDISADAIQIAQKLSDAYAVEVDWRVGDVLNIEVGSELFDVVTDQGCFHHMTDEGAPDIYKKCSAC